MTLFTKIVCLIFCIENPYIMCSIKKLLELFKGLCNCCSHRNITYTICGCSVIIQSLCINGHPCKWVSSDFETNAKGHKIYTDNLNFASSIILSGNHYSKIALFCRFMKIAIVSSTTFHAYQRLFICPAIDEFYSKEQVNAL